MKFSIHNIILKRTIEIFIISREKLLSLLYQALYKKYFSYILMGKGGK